MNTNKINWKNAIIGGVLGTIAFDIIGFFLQELGGIYPVFWVKKQV